MTSQGVVNKPSSTAYSDPNRDELALAIDIGGTKTASAVVSFDGRILGRSRVISPAGAGAEEFLHSVISCANESMESAGVTTGMISGVGCGCGGPIVWPSGVVSPMHIPSWRRFPLRRRLSEAFGFTPTRVHNDAVALVVGEHWQGRGNGTRNMVGVTVSTGVGGGLILNNKLFHGNSGNAGHFGHVIVIPGGPECSCGSRGCLDAVASGPSTVQFARSEGWLPPEGAEPTGRSLAKAAESGDPIAIRALHRSGSAVGRALVSSAALLDLECAVIAGGFSRSGSIFWDAVRSTFEMEAKLDFAGQMAIVSSDLYEKANLLGAAAFVLLPDRYGWSVSEGHSLDASTSH